MCPACDGRFRDRLVTALGVGGFTFGWPSKRILVFVETLFEHWTLIACKQRRIVTEWFILRPCHFRGISVLCPKALSSAFGVRLP
ncbi:hypothetical protein TorRG33x02_302310 [Trema orientale]|uniref:Uncharacterized protein n=1 Tax=Trema orientale TaxID=63057 RepID=A0A2P5C0I2_TREOI|nr:hypothetical protein TorRG33x02_302310 [Trema orientale]